MVEENNQLLPKENKDSDVSAHGHQGAVGLSYIHHTANVNSLHHLTY